MKIAVFVSLAVFGLAVVPHNASGQGAAPAGALHFSADPDAAEIFRARVFDEPLIPVGGQPESLENTALANALSAYSSRTNLDDFSSLTDFLSQFPESKWCPSLLLHLGVEYYNSGYYSKALGVWEESWKRFEQIDDPKAKAQADRALGELARMYSKLGRMRQLSELLGSVTNRSITGPGSELLHSANHAIWMMQNKPGICFRCGPLALDQILAAKNPKLAANPLILQSMSTTNGFSLPQVAALSAKLGMNYQMAFRSPGAPIILPAVVHWKVGHYAALLVANGDRYLVKDHTFHSSLLMTSAALNQEASGYFLVPPGQLPTGWRVVDDAEAKTVWGKGATSSSNPNQTLQVGCQSGGSPNAGACPVCSPGTETAPTAGDPTGSGDPGAASANGCCGGMTTYTMNTMLASLKLNDTPVGYAPPVGPWVTFTATYNQNEANQPATFYYSNFGSDWTCNWIGYVTDNPTSPGADVTIYAPGGGTLSFSGFNSTNQTYSPELMTQAILRMTSGSSYEIQFRTGARKEFTLSDGSTGTTRRIFMTQVIDPAGNAVNLNYDSSLRITNIVDAIGQVTTMSYTNTTFPNAITLVTDPFGRSASFLYTSQGLLAQITDVLGITSQYTYGANEFVNTLITPYGTTAFLGGTTNGGSFLQATDPLGESELLQATQNPLIPASEPGVVVPLGMNTYDSYLNDRNSYYWGKNAFQYGAWVYTNAIIYHFLHSPDTFIESGVLESVKQPLENRVWYNFPSEANAVLGIQSINRPSVVGRVLDNGTTQLRSYQYNSLGRVTNSTDPAGRNFTYIYSTNNIDLLQVFMTTGGQSQLLQGMAYNSQHKPLTITDAAGQTATNTYNSQGQLLTNTDPKGEVTSISYATNGYLLSITGPLQTSNDVVSFAYDAFGRVLTVTDTEGYTLTYAYDAMDRKTRITHPDGTFEQFLYSNLDLVASADRLGRWTTNAYNADRQLIQTQDPLGRTTRFEWCNCGVMTGLIDPMGRETTWDYDLESRPVAKYYADGSSISYWYENTTSRLNSRMDERGQQTVYLYNIDDTLASVNYPDAIIATPTVSYTYDANYNRIVTMQDGIGTTVYTYNPIASTPALGAGQLASVSGPLPNSTVSYQYDPLGRVISRSINGVAQTTSYDILGRPIGVTNALGSFTYSYVDATSQLASEAYPNGQTNLYSYYNNLGDERLEQIQHLYPNGSLLSGFGYAYNAVGQITAWTNQWDTLPTRVWFPAYDAADQLTNVVSVGGPTLVTNYAYAYDPAGNRLLAQSNSVQNQFTYNALNQLESAKPGFTSPPTYEWDAENRLTAISQGINQSEFVYDGSGRRIEIIEKTNGVIRSNNYYLWCGNQMCEIRDSTGSNVQRRLYAQGESLVGIIGTTNVFYARDQLRSVREVVDGNGLLATRYDYDPYGQETAIQNTLTTTFAYSGHFIHLTSGLLLTLFRPLNTEAGRWLSRDPMQERGGVNLYVYALNDPIKYTDQLGADPDESLFTADSCQQPTFLESLPRESDQQILQDQIDELDIEIAMLYVGQGLEKGLEILQTSPDDVPAERTEAILRYLWDVPDEPTAYEYRTEAIQRRSELLDQQKDITIPYGGHVPQINPMQLHKPTISGPYKLEF